MDDLIETMKVVLGSTFTLYLKTQAAHWNVEGPLFPQLHDLFGKQYAEMWEAIDDIAEQIRQLDAYSPASMQRMLTLTIIEETQGTKFDPREMCATLAHDHEKMLDLLTKAEQMAQENEKTGLANFLADRCEAHSKHRWMLRATAK